MHSIVLDWGHLGLPGNHSPNIQGVGAGLYNAFEHLVTQGLCQKVAVGSESGAGFLDFPETANPIGIVWGMVYRWPVSTLRPNWFWEIFVGCTGYFAGNHFNILTNGVAHANASITLIYQVAVGFDSGDNPVSPWNGTTVGDGSDTAGTPRWDANTLHVFPRRNNPGLAYATNRENGARWVEVVNTAWDDNPKRLHVIADEDSLFIGLSFDDNGIIDKHLLVSPFTPLDGITIAPPLAPLLAYTVNNSPAVPISTDLGDDRGGVISRTGQVRNLQLLSDLWGDVNFNPNNQRDNPALYDEDSPRVLVQEPPHSGVLGRMWDDFATVSWGIPEYSTLDGLSRVVMGSANNEYKWNLPWDGVTADPGGVSDENGITF
jgi:hypothetical protein